MAKRRTSPNKLHRMEARIRAIQGAGKVFMIAFALSLGFVVVAMAFPEQRKLEELEQKENSSIEQLDEGDDYKETVAFEGISLDDLPDDEPDLAKG